MAVARRLRFEILRRDGHTCRHCGASAPDVKLTIDHVIPIALGGGDEPSNLVTACEACNSGKTSIAPDQAMVEDVDATALLFARAIEKAAAIRLEDALHTAAVLDWFDRTWSEFVRTYRPDDWELSVERFLALGLEGEMLDNFMRRAAVMNVPWKWFCGCCWKEISARQELARRLIEDGEV